MNRKLHDSMLMEATIVEGNRAKLPEGVLLRVQGLCQKVGVKNANGRIYPTEVWEHVFNESNWLAKVKEGSMIGEADHPESNIPSIQRASHVIREVTWDKGEDIFATFDILDTPTGRILETLFNAGVKVGVSSRGDGSTRRDEEQGADMVEVGYMPDTWDFVINPSTSGAFPSPIHEAASASEYQRAIIEAVESTVNNSPSKADLLECYTRLIALDSSHASIVEAKNTLISQLVNNLTTEEVNLMNKGDQAAMPGLTPPATNPVAFMTEAVQKHLAESMRPLEERLALSNSRIVELDATVQAQAAQIAESEDWRAKYDELVGQVGNVNEAGDNKTRLEAARTKVIPQLIAENERLSEELEATKELVGAHSEQADTNRVAAYIETAIANYPDDIKHQVRAVLEGARDVVDVDQRLTALEYMGLVGEGTLPPAKISGGAPAHADAKGNRGGGNLPAAKVGKGTDSDKGSMPPSKPWMGGATGKGSQKESHNRRGLRERTRRGTQANSGRTRTTVREMQERRETRDQMTVAESAARRRLPMPRGVKDRDAVVIEQGGGRAADEGNFTGFVQNLAESMGK